MGEVELAALLCAFLAGSEEETLQYFDVSGMKRYVRVDCETETHVIEVGLDKVSARDSVHQALFSAHLTGKIPAVVLIDRDGFVGRFEHEMRHVTRAADVVFATCRKDFIVRWAQTRAFREGYGANERDDLPELGAVKSLCDLDALRRHEPAGY